MIIQAESCRYRIEKDMIVLTDAASGHSVYLGGCNDFTLYLGTPEQMRVYGPEAFSAEETEEKNTLVRRYTGNGLLLTVTYRACGATLVKTLSLRAESPVFVARVCLLGARSGAALSRGGEGQPVFLGDCGWCGIEFPVANNTFTGKDICCTQAPFTKTCEFDSLPVVFGVCGGGVQEAFFRYVGQKELPKESLKIYCDWGLRDDMLSKELVLSEQLTLRMIRRLAELNRNSGIGIDYYLMDAFWFAENDPYLKFKKSAFPNGIGPVLRELKRNNLKFGLWFDLNSNHAHRKGLERFGAELGNSALCFACREIADAFGQALEYHIENHGVSLIKLDFAYFECANASHGHSVQFTESKEQSVSNFLAIVDRIRRNHPEVRFLCYNGWTTKLEWIGSVSRHEGYAISPYWAQHVDYLYCGDPRPSELATPSLHQSLAYYTDSMVHNFREAGLPFSAIDDHGTMMGNTPTIYEQGKRPLRLGWLMNAMRGGMKMHLYGDLDLLDSDDERYIGFVGRVYDEIVREGYSFRFLPGDPRLGEPYGYCAGGEWSGYAVVVNPTGEEVTRKISLCSVPVRVGAVIRDGRLVSEACPQAEGEAVISVGAYGFVLIRYEVARMPQAESSVWLCPKETLAWNTAGAVAVALTFTDGTRPVRTPYGYPEGLSVFFDGAQQPTEDKTYIWSGISWLYLPLHGTREVAVRYTGEKPLHLRYRIVREET